MAFLRAGFVGENLAIAVVCRFRYRSPMHKVLFICTANYYRSRFCEHLFNHLANQQHLNWTATSRAVALELGIGNIGTISEYAIEGLQARGVPLPDQYRHPQQLTNGDLQSADVIIVLDENEHRPYMNMKFPDWANRVTYWQVGDLHVATSEEALAMAERDIRDLIQRLPLQRRPDVVVPERSRNSPRSLHWQAGSK